MTSLVLALALALGAAGQTTAKQEEPKVDKNSTRVTVTGCLKGRVLRAVEPREPETARGPNLAGRSFRLAGPKPVMEDVKKYDRQLVEIEGIVRNTDLTPQGPGFNVGKSRVVIGPGQMGTDPTMDPSRTPIAYVAVMDATSVRFVESGCPLTAK